MHRSFRAGAGDGVKTNQTRQDNKVPFPQRIHVNHLLASLPAKDRQRFLAECELVDLRAGEVLCEPGKRMRHAYFPIDCFVSLVTPDGHCTSLEVGLVGHEGMVGASLALGIDVAHLRGTVQGQGGAWRIGASSFRELLADNVALQRILQRYLHVLMVQLSQKAACTHFHVLEARMARWLLMSQDRAPSGQFFVTQQFLSKILGVRRVGVTKAAGDLQGRKLISYSRGAVTILDRDGLELAACGCYRAGEEIYDRILGRRKPHHPVGT